MFLSNSLYHLCLLTNTRSTVVGDLHTLGADTGAPLQGTLAGVFAPEAGAQVLG